MSKIQFDLGFIVLFIIMMILSMIPALYRAKRERKRIQEFTEKKKEYTQILYDALIKTNLRELDSLDAENGMIIYEAVTQLPKIREVNAFLKFLTKYIKKITENPEYAKQLQKEDMVFPVIRQFIYFFAIIDPNFRIKAENEIKEAVDQKSDMVELTYRLYDEMLNDMKTIISISES
ncbi:MAG: hypothetical protein Q6351_009355 [Candidatus Njordarchaeum guaymaensis]